MSRVNLSLIVAVWLACGAVTTCGMYADLQSMGLEEYRVGRIRKDSSLAIGVGLVGGPVGTVISAFLTGFFEHGFCVPLRDCPQGKKDRRFD